MKKFSKIYTVLACSTLMLFTACDESSVTASNKSNTDTVNTNNNAVNANSNNAGSANNSTNETSTSTDLQNSIKQSNWQLISVVDFRTNIPTELSKIKNNVTLNFNSVNNKNTFSFNVGCNAQNGDYSLDENNRFKAGAIFGTQNYCAELDTPEKTLTEFFKQDITMTLGKEINNNTTLTMQNSAKTMVLVWRKKKPVTNQSMLKKMQTYNWKMSQTNNQDLNTAIPDSASVNNTLLTFTNTAANKMSYTLGCNTHTGTVALTENLKLSASGVAMTEKQCNGLMQAEQTLNTLMKQGSTISLNNEQNPTLTLRFDDNTTIKWLGSKKLYTVKVDGQLINNDRTGNEIEAQETKTFNDVSIPDNGFCAPDNIDKYGFMHAVFSYVFKPTCVDHGDSTISYNAATDTQTYMYKLQLTEQ